MISENIIFDDLSGNAALWCSGVDCGELARVAEFVIKKSIPVISVVPESIRVIWPWLENAGVDILARFYLADKKISEQQISDLTVKINNAFKIGACGAQVFLPYGALNSLVEQTHVVRDDLFFNKQLSIGVDINEIDSSDWEKLFLNLQKINATALTLVLTKDMGDKSDFVGRIYGMLDSWCEDNRFGLHFVFGQNYLRMEQAFRLIKSVKPELIKNTQFFVNY